MENLKEIDYFEDLGEEGRIPLKFTFLKEVGRNVDKDSWQVRKKAVISFKFYNIWEISWLAKECLFLHKYWAPVNE